MLTYIITDDENKSRLGFNLLVEDLGISMRCIGEATGGIELIKILEHLNPDICFIDIRMPGITGIDVIRRCNEKGIQTKWVIISGYAEFEYAKSAIELGVEHYLLKPVDEDELLKLYDRLTDEMQKDAAQLSINETQNLSYKMKNFVLENYNKEISIQLLADHFNISVPYASKLFHEVTGTKFITYLTRIRIERAKELLTANPKLKVKRVSEMVGYTGTRHFTKLFLKYTGEYPTDFKKRILLSGSVD